MDAELCCVCHDAPRDTLLLACGHVCTCNACATALISPSFDRQTSPSCPLCRAPLLGGLAAIMKAPDLPHQVPAVMSLQERLDAVSTMAADKSGLATHRTIVCTYLLAGLAASSREHAAMVARAPAAEAAAAEAAEGPPPLLRAALTLRRVLELREAAPCAALLALREPRDDGDDGAAFDGGYDTMWLMLHVFFWTSVIHLEGPEVLTRLLELVRAARGHQMVALAVWLAIRDALRCPNVREHVLATLLPPPPGEAGANIDGDYAAARVLFATAAEAAADPDWGLSLVALEVLCDAAVVLQVAAADGAANRVAQALRDSGAADCTAATLRSAVAQSVDVTDDKASTAAFRCELALRAASMLCTTTRALSAADSDAAARDFAAADLLFLSAAAAMRAEQLRPLTDGFKSLCEIATVLLSRVPALRGGRTALTVCQVLLGQNWYETVPAEDENEAAAEEGERLDNAASGEAEGAAQLNDSDDDEAEPPLAVQTETLRTLGVRCAMAALLAPLYEPRVSGESDDEAAEEDAAELTESFVVTIYACVEIIQNCSSILQMHARLRGGSAAHAEWGAYASAAAGAAAHILDALATALRTGPPQLRSAFEGFTDGIAHFAAFDYALKTAASNAFVSGNAPVFDNVVAADSASNDMLRISVQMRDDLRVASRRFAWPLRRPAWRFASGWTWGVYVHLYGEPEADDDDPLGDSHNAPLWRRLTRRVTYRRFARTAGLRLVTVLFLLVLACKAAARRLGLQAVVERMPRRCRQWLLPVLFAAVPTLWRQLRRALTALAARAFASTAECRA